MHVYLKLISIITGKREYFLIYLFVLTDLFECFNFKYLDAITLKNPGIIMPVMFQPLYYANTAFLLE